MFNRPEDCRKNGFRSLIRRNRAHTGPGSHHRRAYRLQRRSMCRRRVRPRNDAASSRQQYRCTCRSRALCPPDSSAAPFRPSSAPDPHIADAAVHTLPHTRGRPRWWVVRRSTAAHSPPATGWQLQQKLHLFLDAQAVSLPWQRAHPSKAAHAHALNEKRRHQGAVLQSDRRGCRRADHSTTTGILPMRACHSRGPVLCTDSPVESTATVTGMSSTVNS